MFHLLIVDSEEDLLWALSKNLFKDRSDITIHTASSGDKALELLRLHRMSLLIVDLRIKGNTDGFNLILKSKDIAPKAKLILMAPPSAERRGKEPFELELGVIRFIEKPFDINALRDNILRLIEGEADTEDLLGELALVDIVALICMTSRTVLLHLHHRGRRGRIEITKGRFCHAEFDGRSGAEAGWMMLGLKDGDIFMQSDFNPAGQSIDMDWQTFLSRAAEWLRENGPVVFSEPEVDIPVEGWDDDELEGGGDGAIDTSNLLGFSAEELEELSEMDIGGEGGFGDRSEGASEASSAEPKDETLQRAPRLRPAGHSDIFALPPLPPQDLTSSLNLNDTNGPVPRAPTLNRLPPLAAGRDQVPSLGAAASSIEDVLGVLRDELLAFICAELIEMTEGSIVAGIAAEDPTYQPDHEAIAAYYSELLRTAQRAAVACGETATLETLLITTDHAYILARVVPGTAFAQLVTIARDGNLGIAQVVMRRVEASLARVLS